MKEIIIGVICFAGGCAVTYVFSAGLIAKGRLFVQHVEQKYDDAATAIKKRIQAAIG